MSVIVKFFFLQLVGCQALLVGMVPRGIPTKTPAAYPHRHNMNPA